MAVYSVSQVTSHIKALMEQEPVLQDIWVSGEIGNLSRPGSGHAYFTLKDSSNSLRCVMFRAAGTSQQLDNGLAVIAHGRVSLYEVRGDLQLIVDIVQPEGVGELQLRLEQLNLKLENEGLFEQSRKRGLPDYPRRMGVVTSPTGAVWSDIQTVVSRRYPLVELLLAPTPVQGAAAAPGIVGAFQALNQVTDLDVTILARGGGSLEDLWAFNEEVVARAIYSSHAPVISAVGHETDCTIADLVADCRAPTPSAGAELSVPDRAQLSTRVLIAEQSLMAGIFGQVSSRSAAIDQMHLRLERSCPDLDTFRMRIDDSLRAAQTHLKHALAVKSERVDGLGRRLESLNPKNTLRRGYAIVQKHDDGAVVSDAAEVSKGDRVDVTVDRGAFGAEVAAGGGNADSVRRKRKAHESRTPSG